MFPVIIYFKVRFPTPLAVCATHNDPLVAQGPPQCVLPLTS